MPTPDRQPDYRAMCMGMMSAIGQGVRDADEHELTALCKRWGVTPPASFPSPPAPRKLEMRELVASQVRPDTLLEMGQAQGVELQNYEQLINLSGVTILPDKGLEEVGRPGTPWMGRGPATERTVRLSAYAARGFANSTGIYEEHGKEPLNYKNLQSIKEFLVDISRWSLPVPEDCPPEKVEAVERACEMIWSALQHIPGGWERYCEDAASCFQFGFSIFEVVWEEVDGYLLPAKLAFREASSVQDWILDEQERALAGVLFRPGGMRGQGYCLPSTGSELHHHRLLLNVVGRRGLNFEGVPPTRVCDPLIAKKKVLLTIEAACAERFGAPILAAMIDPAALAIEGLTFSEPEWQALYAVLANLRAMDTTSLRVPPGLKVEYISPAGVAPSFAEQLEYIDQQISLAYSNQGALLGLGSHGSYALAEVQENDLFRSAPYYARIISRHLSELIRRICIDEYGLELPTYPRLMWTVEREHDTTKWLQDVGYFYRESGSWSAEVKALAAQRLGIPDEEVMTPPASAPLLEAAAHLRLMNRETPTETAESKRLDAAEAEMVTESAESSCSKVDAKCISSTDKTLIW